MAESNLGEAVLTIRVESALALQEIGRVKAALASGFETATPTVFSDLPKQARQAGEQSGRQLRSGLQSTLNAGGPLRLPQLQVPDFSSIREALNFSGELRATISDLQTYRKALIALRDATGATDPLFKRLTATIQASGAAIKDFERGTGDLVESLARVKNVAAGLTFDAQLAALRAFRSGLQSVANTALDAAKAVASITAKGAIETLKVPVFGLPKETTGIIEKARAQIERLQKQSETASGKVARLSDGVAALGIGGLAAKGVVDVVGDIGQSAANTANLLGQVSKSLNDLPGPLSGLGGISDIFANGNEALQQWAANLLRTQSELSGLTAPLQTVTDLLTSLGPEAAAVGGALAFTFAGFQDLINRSFQPGIEGARNALRGMTEDTQNLLEALARASEASAGLASLRDLNLARASAVERAAATPVGSEENLQATQELLELNQRINDEKQRQFYLQQQILLSEKERAAIAERLRDAATPSSVLALPSSELLQQRVAADGGVTPRRLTPTAGPAIDVGLQNARNFVEELGGTGTTFKRLGLNAGEVDGQLTGLPAIFSLVGDALQGFAGAIGRAESDYQARMQAVNASLEDLRRATQSAADRRDTQARAIGEFTASPITGRRSDGTLIPGSPASRRSLADEQLSLLLESEKSAATKRANRTSGINRRLSDATGSGLIGGAFPLLFGQGIGASVGGGVLGAAGGALGGQFGFGLSLVGTAVGQAFDQMIEKGRTLASALQDPIANFNTLKEAGLISSKSLERTVAGLIETGRQAEATALLQKDLARFGDTSELKALNEAFEGATKAFSELGVAVAQFTAGPLTDFLVKLQGAIRLPVIAAQFDAQVSKLAPQQQAQQRELLKADFQKFAVGTGLSQGEAGVKAYQERLKAIKEIVGKTAQELAVEESLVQARKLYNDQIGVSKSLIDAKYRGDEREINALERKRILLDLANKTFGLSAQDPRAQKANQDASEALYENAKQLEKIDAQRWANNIAASNKIAQIQRQTAITSLQRDVGAPGIQALQALEQLRVARDAEREAQARLRTLPGDPALLDAANQAAEQTKAAAEQTRQTLIDAYTQAKDAARQIGRSIEDAATQLLRLQGGGDGLNSFLNGEARQNNQRAAFDTNLRNFQQDRQTAAALFRSRGNEAAAQQYERLNFSGTVEQVNAQMLQFRDSLRNQIRAEQDYQRLLPEGVKAQNALTTAEASLRGAGLTPQDTIPKLLTSLNDLAQKKWNVTVNVDSKGNVQSFGDLLPSTF